MQKQSNGHGISTLATEPLAESVQFDADSMWVSLADGRRIGVPLAYFPRLLRATPKQRERYVISGGGTGLHWDDLDEDISVRALVMGIGDRTRRERPSRPTGRKAPSRR
jgi:hypothetical protein